MDFIFPSFSIVFTFFLFLFAVLKLGNRGSKKNLPPGPRKLPIIGNLHNLASGLPHHVLRDLAQKYGPLMHLQLGEISTIVVSSSELAKEIMQTHDLTFASRPQVLASKTIGYDSTGIFSSPYNEYWRQLRKICTLELFSAKRVRSFRPIREDEMKNLINRISSNAGSSSSSPINLSEAVYSSSFSIASKAAFGTRCKDQNRFEIAVDAAVKLGAGLNLSDLFPSFKLFYVIDLIKARKVQKVVDDVLGGILNDHRNSPPISEEHEDVVDVLLKYEGQNSHGFQLTADNIKAVMMDLYAAGGETGATTVIWAMSEMMKNPRIMEKAQAEVRQVVFDRRKGIVDETDFSELDYLKLVIKETLRLHPPGALNLRACRKNCEVNGYHIAVKSTVLINLWAIGRDPNHWSDAERFYPERFLEGTSVDFKGTDFEFLPFGAGRRMCPGMSFGLITVELLLVVLLYHFDWKLPTGVNPQDLDMTDTMGITSRRKDDLYLIPSPYQPSVIE